MLADADGEREVPLADYFTGYRQSVRRPDELIRGGPDPAAARPAHRVPQDRQAPLRRHLQRRGRLRARRRPTASSAAPGSGSAAWPPPRSAPWPPRTPWSGRPGPPETVAARPRGAARARAPRWTTTGPAPRYRAAMLGQSLPQAVRRAPGPTRRSAHELTCSERPASDPSVGHGRSRTRAPPCTSPAPRSTPTTSSPRTKDVLHAYPVQVPHAHARVTGARRRAGVRRARRGAGAHRRRRARASTTPASSTTSRCSPTRSCSTGTRSAGCSARRWRRPGSAPPPSRSTTSRCRRWSPCARRSRPRASRARSRRMERGDVDAGLAARAHVFRGEFEFAGQEHFYLETHCRAGPRRRGRADLRAEQHPAPVGDAGDRGPRARPARATRSPCSACGWAAGSAARRCSPTASPRSPRSAPPHRPAGAAAAQPHPGPDHVRQAARLPRPVAGRLRRRRPARRRSTPPSPPTAAGASTCPSRCWPGRCATSTTPTGSRTSG